MIRMNASLRLSPMELEAVAEVRRRIASKQWLDEIKLNSDMFLVRYVRASKFNVDRAERNIKFYIEYIRKQKDDPATILKKVFPTEFGENFKAYVGGRDYEGRPLIMFPECGRRWNLRKVIQSGHEQMFIEYVHKVGLTIEAQILERDADYGICVADVGNVPYSQYFHRRTIEVIVELVRHLEQSAPGVVKRVYFVNAPKLWIALFAAVQAIITIGAEIIIFDSNVVNWKAKLREIIPEDGICCEFGGTCTTYSRV